MTPAEVFQAARDAMRANDWMGVASLCDPATIARFKKQHITNAQSYHAFRDFPGIDDIEQMKDMPAAEVFATWVYGQSMAYQVEQEIASGRVPAESIEELRRSMNGFEPHSLVLGAVYEGERLAHVIFREIPVSLVDVSMEEEPDAEWLAMSDDERELVHDIAKGPVLVQLCRKQPDGGWLLVADDDFMNTRGPGWFSHRSMGFEASPVEKNRASRGGGQCVGAGVSGNGLGIANRSSLVANRSSLIAHRHRPSPITALS